MLNVRKKITLLSCDIIWKKNLRWVRTNKIKYQGKNLYPTR